MRKIFVLLCAVFLASISANAQLEVKAGSFKEVPGFVNVNSDPNYQNDDNDLPFAVVKVRTETLPTNSVGSFLSRAMPALT